MNSAESLVRFAMAGDFDCFLLAGRYTLLEQGALDTVLPVCLEKGISIVVGGVYNSGVLAEPGPAARYNYAPAPPHIVDRTKRLLAVCASHEVPLKAAAIQFPFGHPAVASVLVGCRSTDELEENIRMLRFPISSALWDDLRGEGLVSPAAPLPSSA
jgi:D-threo-aldose 1-dehydrogenase